MKKLGLLGGTAWPSTIEYYRILNELSQAHCGNTHSANLVLWSIDYHEIRQFYPDNWGKINVVLANELRKLAEINPACILICNNTLHEGFDSIREELNFSIPVFHMVDLTVQKARECNYKSVLLLGTKYTMERGYYSAKFESMDIKVTIPRGSERERIHEIQQGLAKGMHPDKYKSEISEILSTQYVCDAVILACTELPLVVTVETTSMEILDPMKIQCEAAFAYASI